MIVEFLLNVTFNQGNIFFDSINLLISLIDIMK